MQGKSNHALIICMTEIQAKAKATGILLQLRNLACSETRTSPSGTGGTSRTFPQALEQRKSGTFEVVIEVLAPRIY